MNTETKRFIAYHEKDDIFTLKLNYKSDSGVDIDLAIRQINGKQKVKSKIPTFYNSEDLYYPVQLSLEQSSSELTAVYKSTICNGQSLVDLTGGFGVDCNFMSTQFKKVSYVERQEELCDLARHNFKALGKSHITIFHSETEAFLEKIEHADWIYIDPARRSAGGNKVVMLSDCEPDVSRLYPHLLDKATRVMIKLSPMMDITAAVRDLPNTSEIHILSVENECKEVLLILDQQVQGNIKVSTINFGKNKEQQEFKYNLDDETNAEVSFASKVDKYLYEPNAAIMKSGAFKLIGNRFGLRKLHINTHLYTSNELFPEFPGRVFEVTQQWGNSKKELHDLGNKTPKANITTRNYPMPVDELRKKLKIKDGGDVYLFACTLNDDQKSIIECAKVNNILF
ncbi:MAG: SAM-dependent methyltransferase [Paludibacter sp.]|nr:SAM-dependent methyltransferase [Paludibacter sp.]